MNFLDSDINYHSELKKHFTKHKRLVLSGISNCTAKAFFIYNFLKDSDKKTFWVCEDEEEGIEMKKHLSFFNIGNIFFLKKEDTEKEILEKILFFDQSEEATFLIFSKEFLTKKLPLFSALKKNAINLRVDDNISSVDFMNNLIINGYEHSEETVLPSGTYKKIGDTVEIHPLGANKILKVEIGFDTISSIYEFDPLNKALKKEQREAFIYQAIFPKEQRDILNMISGNNIFIIDEVDDISDTEEAKLENISSPLIKFTAFPKEDEEYYHLRYLSILKFYTLPDLITDICDKMSQKWSVYIYTKRKEEINNIFKEETALTSWKNKINLIEANNDEFVPTSFQNPEEKIAFITDKEIFTLKKARRNQSVAKMNLNFITSLKQGDYIVHFDHGIGIFDGLTQKTINGNIREYLEIHFAGNDKLFVPVDQSDKVSKYITEDDREITLHRLGGTEWKKQVTQAQKKTEQLAKDLLELYAARAQMKRDAFQRVEEKEEEFAKTFPYEETPGQIKAIMDVRDDLESPKPMDRLICGDVGFGKTEVAMRAAFKTVMNGKQVAFISPITILTEQHYNSFKKRMDSFDIKIEMLSRFRTTKEQAQIIEKIRKGELDIIIGTHRLLQKDINFLNLGLVIIDEEQRFGVKQKETLKKLRTQVDILTLTATPIPRTLNLSLNKLRDITTITTPPPGRLPIITEVRRYSNNLIRDSILKEIKRGGQVYFLHNKVETIESTAGRLRELVPEATFTVAHGQMNSNLLEERILDFKRNKFDVLISSTIIENGIDFANANTMIINNAEKFGLSQLYQLRGRIGRSQRQAFAYLLYHAQKLKPDAKKRLRSIIEASELGAGFQIAMRDLEIRGAGEIIGSAQHGTMKTVGVSHFLKMLQKTIKEMKDGTYVGHKETPVSEIAIELPVNAYISSEYISEEKEKITTYQKLASVDTIELLDEFHQDILDEYGKMPKEMENLFKILRLKIYGRRACVEKFTVKGDDLHIILREKCSPEYFVKALDYNKKWIISGNSLKIYFDLLGKNWFDELLNTVESMGN